MSQKLFIHIPKNAGSATKHFLRPHFINVGKRNAMDFLSSSYRSELEKVFTSTNESFNYTHARWRDIIVEKKQDVISVAIIRNPWDRVVSRYTFRENNRKNLNTGKKYMTFEEFLEERFKYGDKPFYWHRAIDGWYPQVDYVVDDNGILCCDVWRYEKLNDDITMYFGDDHTVLWKNVSNGIMKANRKGVSERKDYKTFYNNKTIEIVADWYKKDIEFFGFTFGGTATKNIWNNYDKNN